MKFLAAIIFTVFVYGATVNGSMSSYFYVQKNCNVTKTFRVHKQVPYEEFSVSGFSAHAGRLNIQTKFKTEEVEVNRTIPVCCDGYQSYDEKGCMPICTKGCGNRGICSSPEVCFCMEIGYDFDQDLQDCKPVCDDPECATGTCIAPNLCTCEDGYKWVMDFNIQRKYTCQPICDNCTAEETCIEPHVCQCKDGYMRELMDRPDDLELSQCKPVCDEECVNGHCIAPNQCKCYENYTRIDSFTCDVRSYDISDFAIPKNCTKVVLGAQYDDPYFEDPKVVLINVTMSICCDGYQNFDDNICIPTCSEHCGIHAICSAPNICKCNKGYTKDNEPDECKPVCEHKCLNGHCIAPNTCACNEGYRKVLDFACAPICNKDCLYGICTAPDTCTCRKGFQLSFENKFKCELIKHKH